MAHVSFKSKELDSMSRWSEYLSAEESSPSAPASWRTLGVDGSQGSASGQKHLQMEPVVQLSKIAEGLLSKMYRLNSILYYPDPNTHTFSDAFWKAGVNFPKICLTLSKKFPEHPNKLQLEKVDKFALDALNENAEGYIQNVEQWIMCTRIPRRPSEALIKLQKFTRFYEVVEISVSQDTRRGKVIQ